MNSYIQNTQFKITDPAAITATDSEVDGANSFTELEDAFGVDGFKHICF